MRRKIKINDGETAISAALLALDGNSDESFDSLPRQTKATAVRYLLEELGTLYPGKALEVRIPPYGAVQCFEGPTHTRGTPPGVIETDAKTWIMLALGRLEWKDAKENFLVMASGLRADLDGFLPLLKR